MPPKRKRDRQTDKDALHKLSKSTTDNSVEEPTQLGTSRHLKDKATGKSEVPESIILEKEDVSGDKSCEADEIGDALETAIFAILRSRQPGKTC